MNLQKKLVFMQKKVNIVNNIDVLIKQLLNDINGQQMILNYNIKINIKKISKINN